MKPPDLPKDRPSLIDQAKALGAPVPLKQVVMGVKLAPKPVTPPQRIGPDDVTPLPPVHARARAATKTAMPAPPALLSAPQPPPVASLPPSAPSPQSRGQEPPRSLTPGGVKVEFPGFKGELRGGLAKKLGAWLLPAVLGAGGGVAGKAGHDAVADQQRVTRETERARKQAALAERLAELETTVQLADAKARRALVIGEDNDAKIQRMQREAIVVKPEK